MSKEYLWALNPQKLARAIGKVGKGGLESDIKAEYIKIGGKVALEDLKPAEPEVIAALEVAPEVKPIKKVKKIKTIELNDSTTNEKVNNPVTESNSDNGGTLSIDDSSAV